MQEELRQTTPEQFEPAIEQPTEIDWWLEGEEITVEVQAGTSFGNRMAAYAQGFQKIKEAAGA